jgi:carbon-monoxide dehydrogenase medium subunit
MIMQPFVYQAPESIDEAVQILGRSPEAKVIAGGHSLLPLMKLGLSRPDILVDLRRIPALQNIRREADGSIVVGALATHNAIATNDLVKSGLAALAEAASLVGDLQVRSWGTIGGSLAHADSAADEPAPTIAFDAAIRVMGPKGTRDIPAREFFKGTFETALSHDEIVIEIRFPRQPERTGSAYAKFPHPASRFAIVGVAAVLTTKPDGAVERAAIGVTGAAAAPFRATATERTITGKRLDPAAIESAASSATQGVTMQGDLAAGSEYRAHLVAVYAKRAIERALERAKS